MKFGIFSEHRIPLPGDTESEHRICRDATTLVALFAGFEFLSLKQQQQRKPGSWHWHIRRAPPDRDEPLDLVVPEEIGVTRPVDLVEGRCATDLRTAW